MKARIREAFRFLCASNFRRRGLLFRAAAMLSRKLDAVSPRLERAPFNSPLKLRQVVKRV